MSHYEQRLERDLDTIRSRMRVMSESVRSALDASMRSLLRADRQLAYETVLKDAFINETMRDIDRLCHGFIARHLPSAGHLRLMSAVIRTALQLERVGDYAVIIAREGVQLSAAPSGAIARQLQLTMDRAVTMLTSALDAFNERNEDKARATMDMAASMEGILDQIYGDMLVASERPQLKNLLATFVVFNQLKRVSDVAKNVCEETLFVTTGEVKAGRVHNVLFVDRDNASASVLAQLIGERQFADLARFASAGPDPAAHLHPDFERFLTDRGYALDTATPRLLDPAESEIGQYFVVVCLDAPAAAYLPTVPFHTSVFEWGLGPWPAEAGWSRERFEALHRELTVRVRDLVQMLTGREV